VVRAPAYPEEVREVTSAFATSLAISLSLSLVLAACDHGLDIRPGPRPGAVASASEAPPPEGTTAPPAAPPSSSSSTPAPATPPGAASVPSGGAGCPPGLGGASVTPAGIDYAGPIGFDLYQPALAPDADRVVAEVGALLHECPALDVEVQVHTDTRRLEAFNAARSQAVADLVRAGLVHAGARAERIAACGYGESRPLGGAIANWDPQNDRVLFVRLDHPAAGHRCP